MVLEAFKVGLFFIDKGEDPTQALNWALINKDQEQIDWLVEGELDADQREQLLTELDQHPDGWKRCALAFLERDALQKSLIEVRQFETIRVCDRHGTDPQTGQRHGVNAANAAHANNRNSTLTELVLFFGRQQALVS